MTTNHNDVHHIEDPEAQADRLANEALEHDKRRRRTMSMKAEVGRDKIMERLKLRAIAKKGRVLDRVELFKGLSRKAKNSLIMNMEPGNYEIDERLCTQGDDAGCLFVLVEGTAKCMVAFDGLVGQEVHRFKRLDVFGESSVKEKPSVRTASIIALSPCKTIELTREKYLKLEKEGKLEASSIMDIVQKVEGDATSGEAPISLQEQLARKSEQNAENHKKLIKKLKMMRKGGETLVRNFKGKKGETLPVGGGIPSPGQQFGVQLANLVVGLGGEGSKSSGGPPLGGPPLGGPPLGGPPLGGPPPGGPPPGGPPPGGPPPGGPPPGGPPPGGPPLGGPPRGPPPIKMTQIAPKSGGVNL